MKKICNFFLKKLSGYNKEELDDLKIHLDVTLDRCDKLSKKISSLPLYIQYKYGIENGLVLDAEIFELERIASSYELLPDFEFGKTSLIIGNVGSGKNHFGREIQKNRKILCFGSIESLTGTTNDYHIDSHFNHYSILFKGANIPDIINVFHKRDISLDIENIKNEIKELIILAKENDYSIIFNEVFIENILHDNHFKNKENIQDFIELILFSHKSLNNNKQNLTIVCYPEHAKLLFAKENEIFNLNEIIDSITLMYGVKSPLTNPEFVNNYFKYQEKIDKNFPLNNIGDFIHFKKIKE